MIYNAETPDHKEQIAPVESNIESRPMGNSPDNFAKERIEGADKQAAQEASKVLSSPVTPDIQKNTNALTDQAKEARNNGRLNAPKDVQKPTVEQTPEEKKFADTKQTELQKREGGKYDKATKEWGTIPNGITDSKGEPFLYKQDSMNGKNVLVAYAPNGQLQYMVEGTAKWKIADPKTDKALLNKFGDMNAEYKKTMDVQHKDRNGTGKVAYEKFKLQQERNGGAEGFLKDKTKGKSEFSYGDDHWNGNEDMRNALNGGKKEETSKETAKVKPDENRNESGEERPITDEERAKGRETEKKDADKSKDSEKKGPSEKEVAEAQKVLDKKDATSAERAEAIKTLTEAKLNELDGKSGSQKEEKPKEEPKKVPDAPKKSAPEVLKPVETEKEQRSRLMGEVRNGKELKKVGDVISDKNKEFATVSKPINDAINETEKKMAAQDTVVDTLEAGIRDLKQESAGAAPAEKGKIDERITALEKQMTGEKVKLETLKKDHDAGVKVLQVLREALDSDLKMLDTMQKETEKLAKRTEEKIKDMGKELIGLGNDFLGVLARDGIDVRHDESLGLSVKPSAKLSDFLKNILPSSVMNSLSTENPLPLLGGLQSVLESAKKEAQKKKK